MNELQKALPYSKVSRESLHCVLPLDDFCNGVKNHNKLVCYHNKKFPITESKEAVARIDQNQYPIYSLGKLRTSAN